MGIRATAAGQSLGTYRPEMQATFLPRCAGCGAPHPRARKLDIDVCPDCGTAVPSSFSRSVPATLAGLAPWTLAARLCLAIGKFLTSLARSL